MVAQTTKPVKAQRAPAAATHLSVPSKLSISLTDIQRLEEPASVVPSVAPDRLTAACLPSSTRP